MKKILNLILVALFVFSGAVVGNILSAEEVSARRGCENLACKHDIIGGFRCFNDGTVGYGCDDSGYPDCSETRCGPGEVE